MTLLAPTLQAFFTQRLIAQRQASPNTIASYRDAFRLLLTFAQDRTVLAIPPKRAHRTVVTFLTDPEVDALLDAPNRSSWLGRRDHALLLLAIQTGLRVSELTSLQHGDVSLGHGAHVRVKARAAKSASPRSPPRPFRSCANGSSGMNANQPIPCSLLATAASSAATPSNGCLQDTPKSLPSPVQHGPLSASPPTCYATPARCDCCTPALTAL
jgi:hypothetical protein